MAEDDVRIVKPSIDYTKIPEEFAGKWVAVNRNTHALLGASDTPEGALEAAAVSTGHPTLQALVMTRVPEKPGMAESKPEPKHPLATPKNMSDEDLLRRARMRAKQYIGMEPDYDAPNWQVAEILDAMHHRANLYRNVRKVVLDA